MVNCGVNVSVACEVAVGYPKLFERALDIYAYGFAFTGSRYELDGVSGKVLRFVDWLDPTHYLAQATSANQCAVPAATAAVRNALTAAFDSNPFYVSTRAAAEYSYLHNETDSSLIFGGINGSTAGTRYMVATRDASGTSGVDIGMSLSRNTTPNNAYNVRNDTSTSISSAFASAALNEVFYLDVGYSNRSTKWRAYKRRTLGGSGDPTGAPSTAAPSGSLTLGARAGAGSATAANRFIGNFVFMFGRPKRLRQSERQAMRELFRVAYDMRAA
jgi:hypothetical protein